MSPDTVLTYNRMGNEQYHRARSNLVVKLDQPEDPNCRFRRVGDNLIYTHSIGLKEALNCSPIDF